VKPLEGVTILSPEEGKPFLPGCRVVDAVTGEEYIVTATYGYEVDDEIVRFTRYKVEEEGS